MAKPVILISACLLGVNCRYNGSGGLLPEIAELKTLAQLVPVCPEILGGLPTPRPPAERLNGRVVNCEGGDVTDAYARGARESLALAQLLGAHSAILKERSPSCGAGEIYDGSFSHTRIPGDGVTSELLKQNGICVCGESRIPAIIEQLKEGNEHDPIQL